MSWCTQFLNDMERENSVLWRACCPRRYLPPAGYANPRDFGASMWGHIQLWDSTPKSKPSVMASMASIALMDSVVPTYFVEVEFAKAVASTKLPTGLRFADLKWPADAMLFVLPDAFSRAFFGRHVPFIAAAHVAPGEYPKDTKRLKNLNLGMSTPVFCPEPCFVVAAHAYLGDQIPCEYTALHPDRAAIDVADQAFFSDAVPMERSVLGVQVKDDSTPEEDNAIVRKIIHFVVKLLLIVTTAPHSISNGELARPFKAKKGRIQSELWHPNMIGRNFRLSRETAPNSGTHASPRGHLRWGHLTHQFRGERGPDFVSTSQLPRKADGTIDWDSVSEETRARFWKNHELKWIKPVVVNAAE